MKKEVVRKSIRLTPQVAELVEKTAESLRMYENKLIDLLLFDVLTENNKFVDCPSCGSRLIYKPIVNIIGICQADCKCGTSIWWDSEENKIIKVTKHPL